MGARVGEKSGMRKTGEGMLSHGKPRNTRREAVKLFAFFAASREANPIGNVQLQTKTEFALEVDLQTTMIR